MRKTMAFLLIIALLCCGMTAYAGVGMASLGNMKVVNCEEWVSLRKSPSTSAERLAQVPLGAVVTDCIWHNEFINCTYNGVRGYILTKYLTETNEAPSAATEISGTMTVTNCEEWVSLRKSPSTSAERYAKVPLGASVTNCASASNGFIRCDYQGMTGYILAEYLAAASSHGASGEPIFEAVMNGFKVLGYHEFVGEGERVFVECTDAQGKVVWSRESHVPYMTELTNSDVFLGGTMELPRIMLYNGGEGLYSLDFFTGEEIWLLPNETVHLGGSISHAVAEDGTMYIGGYYGPDPVAISFDGELLWQADPRHDAYWMYEILITETGIVAVYDCIDEHEAAGQVTFGFDGEMLSVEWF